MGKNKKSLIGRILERREEVKQAPGPGDKVHIKREENTVNSGSPIEKSIMSKNIKSSDRDQLGAPSAPSISNRKRYKKKGVIIREDIYEALTCLRKENGTTMKEELNKALLRGLKGFKIKRLTEEDKLDNEDRIEMEGCLYWIE